MNWANRITLLRIILIFPIIILLSISGFGILPDIWSDGFEINIEEEAKYRLPYAYLIVAILFIIASFSDFLDGYVARKYNLVSDFGKFFDAIADKLLTSLVLIMLSMAAIVPFWITIIIIARDIFINALRQIAASKNVIIAADNFGKYKTMTQMVGIIILLFVNFNFFGGQLGGKGKYDEFGWINQVSLILMYISVVFTIGSMINYVIKNKEVFKSNKI